MLTIHAPTNKSTHQKTFHDWLPSCLAQGLKLYLNGFIRQPFQSAGTDHCTAPFTHIHVCSDHVATHSCDRHGACVVLLDHVLALSVANFVLYEI